MANRRLTWVLPPVTARQHPIAGVEIAFRVDASLPWTVQTTVPANTQELLFQDVPVGDLYHCDEIKAKSWPDLSVRVDEALGISLEPTG